LTLCFSTAKFQVFKRDSVTSWPTARGVCEKRRLELCLSDDLCRGQTNEGAANNGNKFYLLDFPFANHHWVPVYDEYNDWIYVGPTSSKQCKREVLVNGPGVLNVNTSRRTVVCCEKANRTLPASVPVTVYVYSALVDDVVRYKFSLSPENTLEELRQDSVSWVRQARYPGDINSFGLMSNYRALKHNVPYYFCKSNFSTALGLRSSLYKVGYGQCEAPFTLDFYLFGSDVYNESSTLVASNDNQGSSRISKDLDRCCEYIDSPLVLIQGVSFIKLHEQSNLIADPCAGIQKLWDVRGVISSSSFELKGRQGSDIRCLWRVAGAPGSIIRVNFTNFNMQSSGSDHRYYTVVNRNDRFRAGHGNVLYNFRQQCPVSSVFIRAPSSARSTNEWLAYGVVCGTIRPPSFLTISNAVVFKFSSDSWTKYSARFSLIYEILSPPANLTRIPLTENSRTWLMLRRICGRNEQDLCFVNDICRYGNRIKYICIFPLNKYSLTVSCKFSENKTARCE